MRKLLIGALTAGAVAGVAMLATNAFFSDTETSAGNVFQAGKVDLTIDSQCHYFTWEAGEAGYSDKGCKDAQGQPFGVWADPVNLTDQKFWNFSDVKPGDYGENTISLHVESNPVWACIDIKNMQNNENDLIDPESEAGDVTAGPLGNGELAQNLHFTAWLDESANGKCDNIWNNEERLLFSNVEGPASDVLNGKTYTLADSSQPIPFPTGTTCLGLQWCAGSMTVNQVTQTITCDGSTMDNTSQTDSLTADVAFRVEQSRNNPNFLCTPPVVAPQ